MTRRGTKGTKGVSRVSWLSPLFVGFVFQSLSLSLSAPVLEVASDSRSERRAAFHSRLPFGRALAGRISPTEPLPFTFHVSPFHVQ